MAKSIRRDGKSHLGVEMSRAHRSYMSMPIACASQSLNDGFLPAEPDHRTGAKGRSRPAHAFSDVGNAAGKFKIKRTRIDVRRTRAGPILPFALSISRPVERLFGFVFRRLIKVPKKAVLGGFQGRRQRTSILGVTYRKSPYNDLLSFYRPYPSSITRN